MGFIFYIIKKFVVISTILVCAISVRAESSTKKNEVTPGIIFQILASESELGFELFMSILEISDFTNIEPDIIIKIIEQFIDDKCGAIKIDPIIGADQRLDHLNHLLLFQH